MDENNVDQRREISDVRWCTMEAAKALIRPYNTEKRAVLEAASAYIK
jgi:NADH pyrophosphatase NudC (nudix superfamily)